MSHAKAKLSTDVTSGTYVHKVFPFFLFILCVSMPIAVAQRLKRNSSRRRAPQRDFGPGSHRRG